MIKKENLRKEIWDKLYTQKISLKSPYGRIPSFKGSTEAAKLLRKTDEWINSEIIFTSPDTAIIKVREYALKDKKILIMASPKLKKGYLLINPFNVLNKEKEASTISGAYKLAQPITKFPKVDIVIEGSVAVDLDGNRLGKGGGYADREISHLISQNSINYKTPIVTIVHENQIVDLVPTEAHDQRINMIITPIRVLRIKS